MCVFVLVCAFPYSRCVFSVRRRKYMYRWKEYRYVDMYSFQRYINVYVRMHASMYTYKDINYVGNFPLYPKQL